MTAEAATGDLFLELLSAFALLRRFHDHSALDGGSSQRADATIAIFDAIRILRVQVLISRGKPHDRSDARRLLLDLRHEWGDEETGIDLALDRLDNSEAGVREAPRSGDVFDMLLANAFVNAGAHRVRGRTLEKEDGTTCRRQAYEDRKESYFGLIGASDEMQDLYAALGDVVPTELPVLILGETGTGKELVAHLIHSGGPRRDREFVATNCAGMAETLLEAELFGHERGAFTGADRARPGLFELAHRGTLFFDEVGDMSPRMQADVLRALQSGEVRRVGGRETKHVDVRVIAATHRNLPELIHQGLFRQDLYFRLNVLSVNLPPLRDHPGDIPLLAEVFFSRWVGVGQPAPRVSAGAMRHLKAYPWPGNVRELENIVRRLLVRRVPTIEEVHLPTEIARPQTRCLGMDSLRDIEDDAIRRAVETAGGKRVAAARVLGINRKTLYLKLKRLNLEL